MNGRVNWIRVADPSPGTVPAGLLGLSGRGPSYGNRKRRRELISLSLLLGLCLVGCCSAWLGGSTWVYRSPLISYVSVPASIIGLHAGKGVGWIISVAFGEPGLHSTCVELLSTGLPDFWRVFAGIVGLAVFVTFGLVVISVPCAGRPVAARWFKRIVITLSVMLFTTGIGAFLHLEF